MSAQQNKSARVVAAQVLRGFDPQRDSAGAILDRLLDQTQERQRATDLVYGTIRNLRALDAVIARFSGRRPGRIALELLSIIRVGVYELVYSPATPAYSIVDEAASQAGHMGGRKQTGFVNAVLRQVARHIVNRQAELATAAVRRTLVRTPVSGCEFDTEVLPDPDALWPEYLATCFSLPPWLVTQWVEEFGPQQARNICLACNRRPSLYVRVNPLRSMARDLVARFEQAGIKAEPAPANPLPGAGPGSGPASDMLRVAGPHAVTQLPGFTEGLFTVQDLAAARVVPVLAPQPDWSILDVCAAPGTKTTQLAELTRDAARITATDIDPERLVRVCENLARLAIESVTVVPYAQLEPGKAGPFDAILLDVPCSNTGVLARRVEARFRITPEGVGELAAVQRGLLEKAAALLKPTGRICYGTCSIQRRENQDAVRAFLAAHPRFELVREEVLLPSAEPFDHDGAYAALLVRKP